METKMEIEKQVLSLIRDYGMSSVLLRNAVSRRLGLNITDMECLSLLSIKGISTPTELAEYTGMTSGSATVMLDRLEKAKLIKRKPNPRDRRGVLIEINNQSISKMATLFTGAVEAQKEVVAGYSENELTVIADFLSHITNSVSDQISVVEQKQ